MNPALSAERYFYTAAVMMAIGTIIAASTNSTPSLIHAISNVAIWLIAAGPRVNWNDYR